MAEVKDVFLDITDGSSSSNRKVTVSYKLAFTSAEAGKSYKVVINLFGDDVGETGGGPVSLFPPQPLYTFTFGQFLFQRNYQTVTAQAGEKSYSFSREVSTEKLDEDPGVDVLKIPANPPLFPNPIEIPVSRPDEIYAVVSLTSESKSAPSVKITL